MDQRPEQLRQEAMLFFRSVDTAALREDLIELFLQYILARHAMLPPGFERMGERFCVFVDFLKDIESLKRPTPDADCDV